MRCRRGLGLSDMSLSAHVSDAGGWGACRRTKEKRSRLHGSPLLHRSPAPLRPTGRLINRLRTSRDRVCEWVACQAALRLFFFAQSRRAARDRHGRPGWRPTSLALPAAAGAQLGVPLSLRRYQGMMRIPYRCLVGSVSLMRRYISCHEDMQEEKGPLHL
jgi:hypothetical protein